MIRKSFVLPALCVALLGLTAEAAWAQQPGKFMAFAGEVPRVSARLFFFDGSRSPGQFSIDYGQPEWKAAYDTQFDAMTKGKRIRFGKDFWTTLDTNLPLTIGGKEVAAGHYYLALERSNEDKWSLVLLDPKEIQSGKTDGSQTDKTKGGTLLPLSYEPLNTSVDKLTIKLVPGDLDVKKSTIVITWGKHKLTAAVVAQVQST